MQPRPLPIVAAVAAAVAVVAATVTARERLAVSWGALVVGGLWYAVGGVGLWLGSYLLAGVDPTTLWPSTRGFLLTVAVGTAVLWLQAVLAGALYARGGLLAPLAALATATAFAAWLLVGVGGESDGLFIYGFVYGPAAVGLTALVGAVEVGARRLYPALAAAG